MKNVRGIFDDFNVVLDEYVMKAEMKIRRIKEGNRMRLIVNKNVTMVINVDSISCIKVGRNLEAMLAGEEKYDIAIDGKVVGTYDSIDAAKDEIELMIGYLTEGKHGVYKVE